MKSLISLALYIHITLLFAVDYQESKVTPINLSPKDYGNKFFITNRLASIFGEESRPILEKNIISSHPDLAGPCDIYEQIYINREKTDDLYKECIHGKRSIKAPLSGKNTVIRSALIAKTCISLVSSDQVMKYLEAKNKGQEDVILNIHNEFYPLEEKKKLMAQARKIESDHFFMKDILKRTYLLFCLSEDWQLL